MSLKAIFFDLDGTLLPMDQDTFINDYFSRLARRMAKRGYDPKEFIHAIWYASANMVTGSGEHTNEEKFWQAFTEKLGEGARSEEEYLEAFYKEEFDFVSASCGFDETAAATVRALGEKYRIILATNPLFPAIATEKRIAWAGLTPGDFEFYTTYENSHFCKPNLDYYREILEKFNLDPSECLMVGNDVGEDMIAEKLGMKVYLVPACLINKAGEDIRKYPQGTLPGLLEYVKTLD